MHKVGFIGTGSMGSMLITRFLQSDSVRAEDINILNRTQGKALILKKRYPKIQIYTDYQKLVAASDLIFICVKPNDLQSVLSKTGTVFSPDKLLVSTLLAPALSELEKIIEGRIVRIYPSVTQITGRGVTLLTWGKGVEQEEKEKLMPYLKVLGKYYELPENLYRAAGDVTSCGPAFMAYMIGSLAKEAENQGIPSQLANEMAIETMHGTALLLEEQQLAFQDLIKRVATPGGCTAEGIKVLTEVMPMTIAHVFAATYHKDEAIQKELKKMFLQE